MRSRKPDDWDSSQEEEEQNGKSMKYMMENDIFEDETLEHASGSDVLSSVTKQAESSKEKTGPENKTYEATGEKEHAQNKDPSEDSGSSEEDVPLKEFIGKKYLGDQLKKELQSECSSSDDIPLQQVRNDSMSKMSKVWTLA